MRKAMTRAGITFDKSPNEPQPREKSANGKQKGKFAGTAKMKNQANKIAQRSLVHVTNRNKVSDSNDEPQPEYGNVAIVAKPQKKHVSPRTMNAILFRMTILPRPLSRWSASALPKIIDGGKLERFKCLDLARFSRSERARW